MCSAANYGPTTTVALSEYKGCIVTTNGSIEPVCLNSPERAFHVIVLSLVQT